MDVIRAVEDFDYYHLMTGQNRGAWQEWRIKAVEEWKLNRVLIGSGFNPPPTWKGVENGANDDTKNGNYKRSGSTDRNVL